MAGQDNVQYHPHHLPQSASQRRVWAPGQVHPTQCRLFSGDELTWQEHAAVGVCNNRAPHLRGTREKCSSLYFVLVVLVLVCAIRFIYMFFSFVF